MSPWASSIAVPANLSAWERGGRPAPKRIHQPNPMSNTVRHVSGLFCKGSIGLLSRTAGRFQIITFSEIASVAFPPPPPPGAPPPQKGGGKEGGENGASPKVPPPLNPPWGERAPHCEPRPHRGNRPPRAGTPAPRSPCAPPSPPPP